MNKSTNTYTALHPNSGEVIEEGVDAVTAADLILTYDGTVYKTEPDDGGWRIFVAGFNRYSRTIFWSPEPRLSDATQDLSAQVIAARMPGYPEAVLDEVYAAQMEEAGR